MQGLMSSYPLTLPLIFHRAERLSRGSDGEPDDVQDEVRPLAPDGR